MRGSRSTGEHKEGQIGVRTTIKALSVQMRVYVSRILRVMRINADHDWAATPMFSSLSFVAYRCDPSHLCSLPCEASIGASMESWERAGYRSVATVLQEAGLPTDALKRTGLVFEAANLRWPKWLSTRTAVNLHRYCFRWPKNWPVLIAFPAAEQALVDLVRKALRGEVVVERFPPHIAAMRAKAEAKRQARADKQRELIGALVARIPSRRDPAPIADQVAAENFLAACIASGQDPNKRINQIPECQTRFADGTPSLLATGLNAWDRERIVERLRPSDLIERIHATDEPNSGLWVFERPVLGKGILIRACLCVFPGEPSRCEAFELANGPASVFPAPEPLLLETERAHEASFDVGGSSIKSWVTAQRDQRTGTLYTTAKQDIANLNRVSRRVRSLRKLFLPEDMSRFKERWLNHRTNEVEAVLGWPKGRWRELEKGALPTMEENAIFQRLDDPTWLFDLLIARFPKRFSRTAPYCWQRGVVDLSTTERSSRILSTSEPDVFTGFVRMEMDRLHTWAQEVAYRTAPDWELFWRLMFLGDVKHFELFGRGFTGLRYRATTNGPVVPDALFLMEHLRKEQVLKFNVSGWQAGGSGHRVHSHPFFYPPELQAHWDAGAVSEALRLSNGTWSAEAILRACQRAPQWKAWVDEGAWIPYDIVMDLVV